MSNVFTRVINDSAILEVLKELTTDEVHLVEQICERWGDEEDEVRYFDVYSVSLESATRILKKTSDREVYNYKTYLEKNDFAVPKLYGSIRKGEENWILIEKIEGEDLREMTDELAAEAGKTLAQIQNQFWEKNFPEDENRFEIYWKRVNRRAKYVADKPILKAAYQMFLDRQQTCPKTLSMGDFLEMNLINRKGKVYVIDWGFGGIMPYSLDAARFIAHGSEERVPFPFYITEQHKKVFLESLYEHLEEKPEKARFLLDIKLALLNEYIEFMEADEDEDGWYERHALALAEELRNEMVLNTERLELRRIVAEDWQDVKKIWETFNQSEYVQYDRPNDTEDAVVQERIAKWAEVNKGNEHVFFAVCLQDKVIGYVAFNIREDGYEIGYCFHSDYHGKGYAKESLVALLNHMKKLGARKFTAGTALNNTPSVKLLETLGFQKVEEEKVSFYKDENGEDIVFDGGIFELNCN